MLTVGELRSPAYVAHTGDGEPSHRQCGVCFYKRLDPDDYGKPTRRGLLRIMWRRHRQPKEETR